jgi:hypothetical protein
VAKFATPQLNVEGADGSTPIREPITTAAYEEKPLYKKLQSAFTHEE